MMVELAIALAIPSAEPWRPMPPVALAVALTAPKPVLLAMAVATPPSPPVSLAPLPFSPPIPPVADAVELTALSLPFALAVELALPPLRPLPVPLFTSPPLPPVATSVAVAVLLPRTMAVEVLVVIPAKPGLLTPVE
jgi:hypothetical protein